MLESATELVTPNEGESILWTEGDSSSAFATGLFIYQGTYIPIDSVLRRYYVRHPC